MDSGRIREIYGYLTKGLVRNPPEDLRPADGAFVFGRADRRLAEVAEELYSLGLVSYILVTGGFGKDSGSLRIPESAYLAMAMIELGVPSQAIIMEDGASNGGENVRFGMKAILGSRRPFKDLITVAHSTSAWRLNATQQRQDRESGRQISYQVVGSGYPFNPENPIDQAEAISEILRLADGPGKGFTIPQLDLPLELVEWARAHSGN